MALPSLIRSTSRPNLYICARCAFRASRNAQSLNRRSIGTKYLAKVAAAEKEWKATAQEIKQKKKKSMLTILEERGLVQNITG